MRRRLSVLALAALVATTVALTAGSALAANTKPRAESYTDTVEARQYLAQPPTTTNRVGVGMFRGSAGDHPAYPDPGLPGQIDTRIAYTDRAPGPGVTNEVVGGKWILCSDGFKRGPLDTGVTPPAPIPPECTTTSTTALHGTVQGGYAEWDEDSTYAPVPGAGPVYAGDAEVEIRLTVDGGEVNGKNVAGGSGSFEGTLDHSPLLTIDPDNPRAITSRPLITGKLELKF